MAKKKKRPGKRKGGGELQAALEALEIVEKDVARVRENLWTFLLGSEKYRSGGSHFLPVRPRPPKKKTRRK